MPRRTYTDADYQRIVELREAGHSCAWIARRIGCSEGLVAWTCLRLAADPPNARPIREGVSGPAVMQRGDHLVRRFTPEEDREIERLDHAGATYQAIGRALGRRRNSIQGRLMTLARRQERNA